MYQFRKSQLLPISIEEAWDFISNPRNLDQITPNDMQFEIRTPDLPQKVYEGMMVEYGLTIVRGIQTTWITEITKVKEGVMFIDEQRKGPYSIWHHEHWLEKTNEGVLMKDLIHYLPPFGPLGKMANNLFIQNKIKGIFQHREKVLNKLFTKTTDL